jgi:hypothetical protein
MTTEPTTTASDTTTTEATTPKLPKTATITLHAADKSFMQIVAERKGDSARTYVLSTDAATKKTTRGMSADHPSFEAAKKETEKLAAKAAKLGWQRAAARRAFVAKPDAFSTLPAAPKGEK